MRSGQPDPEPLERALAVPRRWLADELTPGVAVVVAREGRVVGELYAGSANGERPVEVGTLFCLASITKLLTACAALTLVEDGLLALDEPLERWLPELADEQRAHLTFHRLLTHASGLPFDLGPEEAERLGPTPSLTEIYAQYPRLTLAFPPGSQVRYSNVNFGLLAQVVERVSGSPFFELLDRRVLRPLHVEHTYLPVPDDVFDQIAQVAGTPEPGADNESFNSAWWRGLGLPWGGAVGSARDVARFMTAFLSESPLPGFLSPVTLEAMTRVQSGDLAGGVPGSATWPRAEWGLGFEVRGDKRPHPFGELTSPETFGHTGISGTMAWADPDSGLVCVVLCNRLVTSDPERRFLISFCRLSNAVACLV
jgi:beta-lactamase class C